MINYKAIGRRIACYRKKLSMTQATLSEELNVSESYISQVERGSAKVSLPRLDEISEVLEIDLPFLLSDEINVSDVPINVEIHEIIKDWPTDKVDFLTDMLVCDDEKLFRDELKSFLLKYKLDNHLCIDICHFSTGEELLESNEIFDIVFLDYQMPGMDGMNVARQLRSRSMMCNIVFITNYPQFVLESFEVQPYRFYVKPVLEEQLISLMNTFIAQQKLLSPIIVINDNEQKIVNAKDIMYLEGDGKYCVIRTLTDTYHSSKTLAQVHSLLPQHCFYRTHKSYVVNLYCVDSFVEKCITTTNNEKVLIGRNKIAEFKRVYANFIKNYYLRT